MKELKGNKNSQRSKKLIKQSFINLILSKEFEKITVTDIIKDAEISRATFYAHFSDIDDLCNCMEREVTDIIDEKIAEFGIEKAINEPSVFFRKMTDYMGQNIERCKTIAKSKNADVVLGGINVITKERLIKAIESRKGELSEEGIVNFRFIYNAVASLIFEWCVGEIDVPFTVLSDTVAAMLNHGSSAHIESPSN